MSIYLLDYIYRQPINSTRSILEQFHFFINYFLLLASMLLRLLALELMLLPLITEQLIDFELVLETPEQQPADDLVQLYLHGHTNGNKRT